MLKGKYGKFQWIFKVVFVSFSICSFFVCFFISSPPQAHSKVKCKGKKNTKIITYCIFFQQLLIFKLNEYTITSQLKEIVCFHSLWNIRILHHNPFHSLLCLIKSNGNFIIVSKMRKILVPMKALNK